VRIALVCPYGWDAPGGVQVHVRNLAVRLIGRGNEVVVLTPADAIPAEPWVRPVGRPVRISYAGTVAPIAPLSYRRTRDALAAFRPDVVHVHEPLTPSVSMFATLSSSAPVVATVHAYLDRSRSMEVAAPILKRVWRRVRIGVAVSEAAAAFLHRALPEAELDLVPNGVDVAAWELPGRPVDDLLEGRRIVWASRLDPQKGFPVALAAFAKVLIQLPDAALVVLGDGRDRESLGLLTDATRARIDMRGAVPNEELPPYHAACEIFVSAAWGQESFGVVLLEAMAAGLPVVATDIPGYREVVDHGVEGLLVPPRNPEALAAGLVRVLREPGLAERLGEAGRRKARRYDWSIVVDRLEGIYTRAIEGAGYDRPR
jgi:phosphatidyl-myo-inositol alpha-mannosyltransferase